MLTTVLNGVGPVRRKAAGQITGIGFVYRAPRGSHALVGTRVPDVTLKGGRLYEALRGGRFVLVAPTATVRAYGLDDLKGRKDRLAVESWASDRRTTLLVRPDGYVAWAAESPTRRPSSGRWRRRWARIRLRTDLARGGSDARVTAAPWKRRHLNTASGAVCHRVGR